MEVPFLVKCFLIGAFAASGVGPIFVLTFNRSAVCGFWKGFATAIGACCADFLFFSLGLLGALAVISEFTYFMVVLDLVGGVLLLALGIHSVRKVQQAICMTVECSSNAIYAIGKGFTLTVLNPLVVLFFMAVTLQVLPCGVTQFSCSFVLLSSLLVFMGSLSVLSLISLVATSLGSCLTVKHLRAMSGITGSVFISFGLYLLGDFFYQVFNILQLDLIHFL